MLNAIESVLETTRNGEDHGHADDTICVFGYTMMARGNSFVTDYRVPSHLVLSMRVGASIDQLVQTAGRATFMRQNLLSDNGWVDQDRPRDYGGIVRLLMPELDYNVVRAYPQLVETVDKLMKDGKRIHEIFAQMRLCCLNALRKICPSSRRSLSQSAISEKRGSSMVRGFLDSGPRNPTSEASCKIWSGLFFQRRKITSGSMMGICGTRAK